MKQFKMSNNDAWDDYNKFFGADVIVTTDNQNNYQKAEVQLQPANHEVPAHIQLHLKDDRFVATLTVDEPLHSASNIDEVNNYGQSLQHYSDFMLLLEDEATSQLRTAEGTFEENNIKY